MEFWKLSVVRGMGGLEIVDKNGDVEIYYKFLFVFYDFICLIERTTLFGGVWFFFTGDDFSCAFGAWSET